MERAAFPAKRSVVWLPLDSLYRSKSTVFAHHIRALQFSIDFAAVKFFFLSSLYAYNNAFEPHTPSLDERLDRSNSLDQPPTFCQIASNFIRIARSTFNLYFQRLWPTKALLN